MLNSLGGKEHVMQEKEFSVVSPALGRRTEWDGREVSLSSPESYPAVRLSGAVIPGDIEEATFCLLSIEFRASAGLLI
jgi:hypothetical protein